MTFSPAMVAVLCVAGACSTPARESVPTRLVVGTGDTLVVNNRRAAQIPVRVLDAAGHELSATGVRFERIDGDSIAIGGAGTVTCDTRRCQPARVARAALQKRVAAMSPGEQRPYRGTNAVRSR